MWVEIKKKAVSEKYFLEIFNKTKQIKKNERIKMFYLIIMKTLAF